jgi:phage-related protein
VALLSVGKAFLTIVPDVSQLKSQLTREVDPAVQSSMKATGRKMQAVGAGMTAGLTLPLVALGKTAVTAFGEAEKVSAQVAQTIESTGGAANVTAQHVDDLASSISGYSGIDDEAIKSGAAMLLTFKDIRNEAGKGNDIFDQTTSILADMSTAMGTDAKSQAIQLGKALNDPVKGVSALSRVGVTFSDKQKKVIEALVKTGDTAGAQRVILKELESEFGGQAKAFGDTAAGSAAKSKVAWGNALEDIGAALAPVITQLAELAGKIASWFSGLPSGVKTAIVVVGALLAVLGPVVGLIGTIITIAPAVGSAFTVMLGPVGLIILAIAALVAIVIIVIKNFDTIKRVAGKVWGAITGFVQRAADKVKGAFLGALDWIKRNWPTILAIITGPIGLAVLVVVRNWDKIKGAAQAVIEWLKGAWRTVGDVVRGVWNGLTGFVAGVWRGITGAVKTGINVVIDAINVLVRGANTIIGGINRIPGPQPDIPTISEVAHLASGGIVLRPTLALIGEAGPEAVVPLGGSGAGLELVGELALTPDGRAFVRGVVHTENDASARHARAVARMGRRE